MKNLGGWKHSVVLFLLYAATPIASPAQTFTTLAQFNYDDGAFPQPTALVQGTDGNFYGTAYAGGPYHIGTIFQVTPGGTLTMLHFFDGPNGVHPLAGLVQDKDGNLYGTTAGFGFLTPNHSEVFSAGNIFKVAPGGTPTTLYTFCGQTSCINGSEPHATLVQATNGYFYGTTQNGGGQSSGTVFEITPSGTLTSLYSFCAQPNCADGSFPDGTLVQARDGNFYGTTQNGGANTSCTNSNGYGCGTVFQMTAGGTLTTLYSFCAQPNCTDGSGPFAGLVQASDGNFYGTTYEGGINNQGTIFQITSAGSLTTLYSFCSQSDCADGAHPYAGLIQASDGNFYGTTYGGGANNRGTIFEITSGGTLTTLYSFCSQANCSDGEYPKGGLVQGTDGIFYGTTYQGGIMQHCPWGCGSDSAGTVFSLDVGLKPSVRTLRTAAK